MTLELHYSLHMRAYLPEHARCAQVNYGVRDGCSLCSRGIGHLMYITSHLSHSFLIILLIVSFSYDACMNSFALEFSTFL